MNTTISAIAAAIGTGQHIETGMGKKGDRLEIAHMANLQSSNGHTGRGTGMAQRRIGMTT